MPAYPGWSANTDDLFFSRHKNGLAVEYMPRNSPQYHEFKEFHQRLWERRWRKLTTDHIQVVSAFAEETALMRHSLVLFADYSDKKEQRVRKKITEDRSNLPIAPFKEAIVQNLRAHRVILVAGDTGCGKSTQVPQFLLEAGFRHIACTQPRRIACYSLAKRVAYETLNVYGSEIAYQVRFQGNKSRRTRILFLTEGLLLRQFGADPNLSQYDVIIVDEVHERHIMGDFLLGILKQLLDKRKDLHVVLMSATINAELFAKYFDAPTIQVPGRLYEVKVQYRPIKDDDQNLVDEQKYLQRQKLEVKQSVPSRAEKINPEPYLRIMQEIDHKIPETERGDMLIFMSGINEIQSLVDELTVYAHNSKRWIVLRLHSTLSVDEQDKVFDIPQETMRKCIVSSNIAETSVTIDGIRFIIDSGKVKELVHEPNTNMSRLSEFWISKSSAIQRTGRAGRTGPGTCYRLYSDNEFNHLNDFPVPEIHRAPLEPVVMELKALDMGDPREFHFIETLGALNQDENITPIGRVLAVLPVDAILGKMMIMATMFALVEPVLITAAAMSVQSPFIRLPANPNADIVKNRAELASEHGDPFTVLNLWRAWLDIKSSRNESSRKWCKRHGVEEQRLYEMTKLKSQFQSILHDYLPSDPVDSDDGMDIFETDQQRGSDRLKQQKLLRRERQKQSRAKRRRVLTLKDQDDEDVEGENPGDMDIHDLEFTVTNDVDSLRSASSKGTRKKDIALLKFIICSGLYPQFASGDEHNPYRKSNELIFHTQNKKFLSIHPSSVFTASPEWVQGLDRKVRQDDESLEQSLHHELICYLQLLETNKPYLLNLTRVPGDVTLSNVDCPNHYLSLSFAGVHMLLLLARNIDTNADCSVLVIDNFYIVKFRTAPVSQHVLLLMHELRQFLKNSIEARIGRDGLQSSTSASVVSDECPYTPPDLLPADTPKCIISIAQSTSEAVTSNTIPWKMHSEKSLLRTLAAKLSDFLMTSISCEFRMAKASELLKIFPTQVPASQEERESMEDYHIPKAWERFYETLNRQSLVEKTGNVINEYLRYASLNVESCAVRLPPSTQSSTRAQQPHFPQDIGDDERIYWFCENCSKVFDFTRQHIVKHWVRCGEKQEDAIHSEDEADNSNKEAVGDGQRLLEDTEQQTASKTSLSNARQRKVQHCAYCGQDIEGGPIARLKHERACVQRP
ncbi:hypothetical protein BZG36_01988 [Bifiguratus adelaidae]|uniref:ATP-dependent RNA helicase DHX34 n=1 Tax=Bifiguratus adelaidae TaxID=1938954 RepID=A0A261Y493_9FUNG|nr:hypothetical protein BZG36_01988 [Bifiguratus adelaidae]